MPTHALEFPQTWLSQTHPVTTALNLSQKLLTFCDDQNWKGSEFPYALSFITFSQNVWLKITKKTKVEKDSATIFCVITVFHSVSQWSILFSFY